MPVSLVTGLCFRTLRCRVAPASRGLRSIISEVIRKFDVETTTATNRLLRISSRLLSLMKDKERER